MANTALDGKPYAGNPHVRIDEGDGASAKPRRSSLLYKRLIRSCVLAVGLALGGNVWAEERVVATPILNADGLETSFNLTIEAEAERYLAIAWDEVDRGDSSTGWAHWSLLGEVAAGTSTETVSVPEGWGTGTRAVRFFLVEKNARPYDARVEWIESSGREWINTGWIGQYGDVADFHFLSTSTDGFLCGSFEGASASANKRCSVVQLSGGFMIGLNDKWSSENGRRQVVANQEYWTRTSFAAGAQTIEVGMDGWDSMGLSSKLTVSSAVANTTAPNYIFARNCNNSSVDGKIAARLYSGTIRRNGTVIHDFIPCVKNGAAVFYDAVAETFCGNISGAGALVAGPTVDEETPGAVVVASAAAVPMRAAVQLEISAATATTVSFTARLLQKVAASDVVAASFAYGTGPASLGTATTVSADWVEGTDLSFAATELSAATRYYGEFLVTSGSAVRRVGIWFVTPGTGNARTVAFGAEGAAGALEAICSRGVAETNVLYLAYGAEPGGDDPETWEHVERVGLVGPETTCLPVTVPGWGAAYSAARLFLRNFTHYPFDRRVQWIESTGEEWINTGWVGSYVDEYDIRYRYLGIDASASDAFLLASYGTGSASRYAVVQVQNKSSIFMIALNETFCSSTRKTERGADMRMVVEMAKGSQKLKAGYLTGVLSDAGSMTVGDDPANAFAPLYLFARNCGNTKADGPFLARLYSCSIKHDGALVRDYIPCVKNGEAMLYDAVEGTLSGNISGAGAFVAGPEVPGDNGKDGEVAARSSVLAYSVQSSGQVVVTPRMDANGLETAFDLAIEADSNFYLGMVWDEVDRGDDVAGWTHFALVGEVAGGSSSKTVPVPEGWGTMARAVRFVLLEKVVPLYDSRVAWIESTGNEWIDTSWIGQYGDVADFHFLTYSNNGFLCGSFEGASASANKRCSVVQLSSGFMIGLNDIWSSENGRRQVVANQEYWTRTSFASGAQTIEVGMDGWDSMGLSSKLTVSSAVANTTAPSYIFARNCNNTSVDGKIAARLYSCTIRRNGTVIHDFIPCVKNGAAVLYDGVTRTFHGNISGTGRLVAGPEVDEENAGAAVAVSAAVTPQGPMAEMAVATASASSVSFTAKLLGKGQSTGMVSATFAYGAAPDQLGSPMTVATDWAVDEAVSFAATGLSAGTCFYGELAVTVGTSVRRCGGWFVTPLANAARTVAFGAVGEEGPLEAVCSWSANETNSIYLAYGRFAGSDDPATWEHVECVGSVEPGMTRLPVTVPGWGDATLAARLFLREQAHYPFDTRVEWIKATGQEWIDTGWIGAYPDTYNMCYRFEGDDVSAMAFLLASMGSDWDQRYTVLENYTNNKSQGVFTFAVNNTVVNTGRLTEKGADMQVVVDMQQNFQKLKVGYLGQPVQDIGQLTVAENPANTFASLYLFARNCGNATVDGPFIGRLYSCTIEHDGEKVRDFVPCLKDGEAMLYDLVQGNFHRNISGAGAFVAGPAVPGGELFDGAVSARSSVLALQNVKGEVSMGDVFETTANATIQLLSLGGVESVELVFEYGTGDDDAVRSTVAASCAVGEAKAVRLSGLSPNTTYVYRAFAVANGVETLLGEGTFLTQGAHRTVQVVSLIEEGGLTYGCRLAFGTPVAGESPQLVLAFGREAGGVDPSTWEGCVGLGPVPDDVTEKVIPLPDGLVQGGFAFRFFFVDGTDPVGVQPLAYIESTGDEWIDTGWIGRFTDTYDIVYRDVGTQAGWFLLGSYGRVLDERYTVVQRSGNKYMVGCDTAYKGGGNTLVKNVDEHVFVSFAPGEQALYSASIGGTLQLRCKTTIASSPLNDIAPLYLFARNCGNSLVDNMGSFRLMSCVFTHNGEPVRDFVPCLKGEEAGLWDRVTGRFFGNGSGKGALVAGPTAGAPATVWSYSAATNGVASSTSNGSIPGLLSASAFGNRIAATVPIEKLGTGLTFVAFEWGTSPDVFDHVVELDPLPFVAGAETRDCAATFSVGPVWGETVYCRAVVSNRCETAAGTVDWRKETLTVSVPIRDTAVYTWQAVDGEASGAWTDPAHWACSAGTASVGYPTAGATAVFPAGTTAATVEVPNGTHEVAKLDLSAKNISVTFVNPTGEALLKPTAFPATGDETGKTWASHFVFDGVSLKSPNASDFIGAGSSMTFLHGASFGFTKLFMRNTSDGPFAEGRLEIGEGGSCSGATEIRWGGDGVVRVEGSMSIGALYIGQNSGKGAGTLAMAGERASLEVGTLLRCWNGAGYLLDSNVDFTIPATGWTVAPLKGKASAQPLAGSAADSASVSTKLHLRLPGEQPLVKARRGHSTPMRIPLIDWPTGITVERIVLDVDDARHIRLAWTYGADGSETPDGKSPTGLVAYVRGEGGSVIILR